MLQDRYRFPVCIALALAFTLFGCESDTALSPTDSTRFSREIGLEEFGQTVALEPTRVEIRLIPGTLTAREVEIEEPEDLLDEEELESPVTAITASADAGMLTLALGDLQVSFDRGTRFEADNEGDLSFDQFVSRIQTLLSDGVRPVVEAKRPPPSPPQAPDDATFFATRLEIEDELDDDQKIEINIQSANFVVNDVPPPDAWLAILGLMIELRVSEGVTRLRAEEIDAEEDFEFEGLVGSVDIGAKTFTIINGPTVRIAAGTRIEHESGDDEKLGSLEEVAAALDLGLKVEAELEGIVEASDPLVVLAIEVEFELEGDDAEGNSGRG